MEDLPLREAQHRRLLEAFCRHLQALGYAEATTKSSRRAARELLWLLEQAGKTVEEAGAGDVAALMAHLARRENRTQGGGLAEATLTANYQGVRRLSRYLWQTEGEAFELPAWKTIKAKSRLVVLSRREIGALYDACEDDVYGLRDRAMLSLYYGCGLRRAEGVALDAADVLLGRRLVYVRQGKGAVERYVPMAEGVAGDLKQYLFEARPELVRAAGETAALFLSSKGRGPKALQNVLMQLAYRLQEEHRFFERLEQLRASRIALWVQQHGLRKAQTLAGHRHVSSTERYQRATLEALKRSVEEHHPLR